MEKTEIGELFFGELDQHAEGGFGMQESDLCPAGANSRLFVYEPNPFCFQLLEGRFDIVHLEADVLDSLSFGFNESSYGSVRGGRFQTLDFTVSDGEKGGGCLLLGNRFIAGVRESK